MPMKKGQHTKDYFTTRTFAMEKMSEELKVSKATISKYIGELDLYSPFDESKFELIRIHYNNIRKDEHKNRSLAVSKAVSGENNPFFGKHHSDETKQRISEAKKGTEAWNKGLECRKHTKEEKELQSEKMKEWHSKHRSNTLDVAEKTGYSPSYCLRHFDYKLENGKAIFDIDNINDIKTGKPQSSYEEKEVSSFIKNYYNGEIIENDRKTLNGKELDIYIPEKKVAIEFNGLYWHSDYINKDKYYHLTKTEMCEKKGIRLIHIFEDDWRDRKEIIQSIILSSLGIYSRKIFARSCTVKEVSKKVAKQFFEENHIHGSAGMFRALGLYFEDELIMCCSFRKEFTNLKKYEKCVELSRMATKLNTQVVGGFSKLMFHSGYKYVESFVDRSLFNGSGYESSCWHKIGYTELGYYYTDFENRFGRQCFMKKSCLKKWPDSDPNLSADTLCNIHGLFKIYNCGNMKLYWQLED